MSANDIKKFELSTNWAKIDRLDFDIGEWCARGPFYVASRERVIGHGTIFF